MFALQVAPLLEELALYTAIGPALQKRKIDVEYIISSTRGMTFGTLIDQVESEDLRSVLGMGGGPSAFYRVLRRFTVTHFDFELFSPTYGSGCGIYDGGMGNTCVPLGGFWYRGLWKDRSWI